MNSTPNSTPISPVPPTDLPTRLGDLDPNRYAPESVRDELRRNLRAALGEGRTLFPGIVGYEETVEPQIVNAILAKHDFILLGLRGQAKTKLCRMLVALLDEWVPVIPGCALRSHPLDPVSHFAREQVAARGDDLEIGWLHRDDRYHEKLATPDVTMADLIGDIDPLKAANEKRDLSDEQIIHYGLIPRSNRGIFAVNELPDLAPRIQVGLLNILEEQDIQIRGFPLRFDLDVMLSFTANPEDYTNRGSIITPLKDRIASQILTHYPQDLDLAREITDAEAWIRREDDVTVKVPAFLRDVVEEIAFQGRDSEYVDQSSGVSARLSIAARELLESQIERRALIAGSKNATGRVVDLAELLPAITGKVELVYEGEQEGTNQVARRLIGNACQTVFDRVFPNVIDEGRTGEEQNDRYKQILDWFASGNRLELSDRMSDDEYRETLEQIPGLGAVVDEFQKTDDPNDRAAVMEFVCEGLHLHSMLAKEDVATGTAYSDMLGIMMEGLR